MRDRFVDTSGWACLVDPAEPYHARTTALVDEVWQARRRLVTTTYVLAELTGLFLRLRVPRTRQIAFLDDLRSDPSVVVVTVEPTFYDDAWQLWRSRPDKDWTLVDCASFAVMRGRGLTDAVTTDHHFEQAGFVRLLR